ncbi:hypothetical protein NS201_10825 [Pseudomonas oryzihabitans]|nr:hypothetical protein NS201_10825 [Pseudomonas psychrotolerans]
MANDLQIRVLLTALDRVTAPLKRITGGGSATARALKEARDRVKELNQQQADISGYQRQREAVRQSAEALAKGQEKLRGYREELKGMDAPSAAFQRTFANAAAAVDKLQAKHTAQRTELQRLLPLLRTAGVDTRDLGSAQSRLQGQLASANTALDAQKTKLAALNRTQERLAQTRAQFGKGQQFAAGAAGAAASGTATAYGITHALHPALEEGKHFDLEANRVAALGLGDKATADAVKYAKAMDTYGTSATENLQLVRDAMTVFADEHHAEMVAPTLAKMKFANHALYGEEQGADNERKFMDMLKVIEMRGGLASPEAFAHQADIVQKVMTATGGRVGPNEWLNVIKTGGVAAKGLEDDAFYNQLEPLVQEMGGHRVGTALMSAYQNLYQGRTTKRAATNLEKLGLVDPTKVKHDKVGQISFLDVGAIKNSKLFATNQFEWMEKVLLPALEAKGIKGKQQTLDAIGSIFSNRTASNLFAQMYLQRDQVHKNAALNRGADGIDKLNEKGQNTAQGMELELLAKRNNLYKQMSDTILPTYKFALQAVTTVMQKVTDWMKDNPATAAALLNIAIGVGLLSAGFGGLALGVAGILGPFLVMRFMLAQVGIRLPNLFGLFWSLGKRALPLVAAGFRMIGAAVIANPIGAILFTLITAATLIYTYWDKIGPWFAGLWTELKQRASGGISGIVGIILDFSPIGLFYRAFAAVLSYFGIELPTRLTDLGSVLLNGMQSGVSTSLANIGRAFMDFSPLGLIYQGFSAVLNYFGVELPAKFTEFGSMIMQGLVNGIISSLGAVKDTVMSVGDSTISFFKQRLGIKSPSRVFATLGDFVMQGLAVGLAKGEDGPLGQIASTAKQLASAGAVALGIGTAATPALANGITFDDRPAMSAAAPAAPASGDTYHITINAGPGLDAQAIAREVQAALARIESQKAARGRSSLRDQD